MMPLRLGSFVLLVLPQCLMFSFIPTLTGFVVEPSRTHRNRRGSFSHSATKAGIGVGIDLGTTNSAIAFLEGNEPRIIEIPNNGRTMKSAVAYDDEGNTLVGQDAIDWEQAEKVSAYRHVKRVMGLGTNFLSKETAEVVPHLVPTVQETSKLGGGKKKKAKRKKKKPTLLKKIEDAENNPVMLYSLNNDPDDGCHGLVSPETISAAILEKLLSVAIEHTGQPITRAVIGVPAYFNDAQRDATVRAANIAGIEKVKLLREPEAAALVYGVDKNSDEEEELVLVFDLGGGTYDVSVLLVEKGLTEIVCTSGDSQLGGSDFDAKIAKELSALVGGCCSSETSADTLVRASEAIRIYLSNNRNVNMALPLSDEGWIALQDASDIIVDLRDESFEGGTCNSTHTFVRWTRKDMERLCLDEFQKLLRPVREVAIMAGALLPGDASPAVVENAIEMEETLTDTDSLFYDEDDNNGDPGLGMEETPQEVFDVKNAKQLQQKGRKKARQVAKQEKKYRAESRKVKESQPDMKIRGEGISGRPIARIVLVGGATRMPTIGRLISSLTGVVPQKTVDPDEAVALGCAVHVGVLDGNDKLGTVLNPMQAALLRAVVDKQRKDGELDDMMFDDEEEFEDFEIIEF